MEDDLQKKGRRPPKKKNDLKTKKNLIKRNGRRPTKNEKWKTTSKKMGGK
jgi:hypothetical protein